MKEFEEKFELGIVVESINVQDYGMMNGENILLGTIEKLQQ